jgi:ABC-2 type transport system permease protein
MKVKAILHVIEYDFKNFFRYRWFIAGLIAMNLADLFISAVVFTQMTKNIPGFNYFQFFAPGLAVVGLFASAFMIGREINMEVRREIHYYLLSLPMTRTELAIGRVLAGGLRGMLYMTPLLITNFIVLRFPTLPELLLILLTLLLLAIGISGVSISIAVSTTSFEKFVTARGVVYYMLFFCSSVFYPLSVIQILATKGLEVLVIFAQVNPLSNGSDIIRSFLLNSSDYAFSPLMLLNVAVFSLMFASLAVFAYMKILQRH